VFPHDREARTPLFLWEETGAENLLSSVLFGLSLSLYVLGCFFFFVSPRFSFFSPSPSRGCLCPAFIRSETAPVVVTAGLLNAL
jgi:hypothetical protein